MTDFQHRQSAHCESGVMANMLTHAGLPMSEPMAFGLGSGLAFAYLPIVKLSGLPLIAYRMPPRHIIKTLSKRLGARLTTATYGNPEKGRQALDAALDAGRLTGMQTSVFWLPYIPEQMRFHFNAHNLLAYGRDGDEYLLSDPVLEEAVRCPAQSLQKARFAKGALAPKGLLYWVEDVPLAHDWEKLVRKSILSTTRIIDSAPLLSFADTTLLLRAVDTTLAVVRSGQTTESELRQMIDLLRQTDIPCMGIALNGVKRRWRRFPLLAPQRSRLSTQAPVANRSEIVGEVGD